jgi:hypothetical protein
MQNNYFDKTRNSKNNFPAAFRPNGVPVRFFSLPDSTGPGATYKNCLINYFIIKNKIDCCEFFAEK